MRNTLLIFVLTVFAVKISSGFIVSDSEWSNYKTLYAKSYENLIAEKLARFYYAVNKARVDTHNGRYDRNRESYRLGVNQFSDLRFVDFAALFPPTTDPISNGVSITPPSVAAKDKFSYTAQGYTSPVRNQGKVCNSGWAYATATVIQIFNAVNTASLNSMPLSAQNLIDCAGGATACSRQVPQTAFDYLTRGQQKLYPESEYRNNPLSVQGMCVVPVASTNGKSIKAYSSVANASDDVLKKYVNYISPLVIKYNPGSFEFMHYKDGVFSQPRTTKKAAHYVTVLGYDVDTKTGKNYWIVQNSFGSTWGEAGIIRIAGNAAKPLTSLAIFPSS